MIRRMPIEGNTASSSSSLSWMWLWPTSPWPYQPSADWLGVESSVIDISASSKHHQHFSLQIYTVLHHAGAWLVVFIFWVTESLWPAKSEGSQELSCICEWFHRYSSPIMRLLLDKKYFGFWFRRILISFSWLKSYFWDIVIGEGFCQIFILQKLLKRDKY